MFFVKLIKDYIWENRSKLLNSLKTKIHPKEVKDESVVVELTQEEMYALVDMSKYGKPIYVNKYKPERKTIIIVDDLHPTKVLYDVAFNNISRNTGVDIFSKYNVIYFLGSNVGFSFLHFLKTSDIKIDFAILDITINTIVSIRDEESDILKDADPLEIDGVDLAIEIDKKYKDAKIMFNSAHSMNPRNPLVSNFMAKFKKHFNVDIRVYAVDKLSNLTVAITKLLKRESEDAQ